MSNDAINHTIKLTVEDGKYYLTMDFHGLAYLNKFGYLAELSYYDNGYTYGQYGTVEGALIPATVLSTQKTPTAATCMTNSIRRAAPMKASCTPTRSSSRW